MKFKKYASKSVVAILLATVLLLGTFFNQHRKINDLQRELYIQRNMTEQKYNYTETSVDVDSIQANINKICEYKILDGTVNIKHTYHYVRDGLLGMKHDCRLTGTADFYYELTTNLRTARVLKADTKEILIEVKYPTINEAACHRVANTFLRMDSECSSDLLTNKQDTEKTTRHWEDTFDKKGAEYIREYYTYDSIIDKTTETTIEQIELLFKELGYDQNINVIIK